MSREIDEGGAIDPSDELILIPPGLYTVVFIDYETRRSNGQYSPKVAITMEVTDEGPHKGVRLQKFYPVKSIQGSPRPGGGFMASLKGDLYRDYVRFNEKPNRRDRIRLTQYADREIVVEVATVTADGKGRSIPEAAQYSVIRSIAQVSAVLPPRQTSCSPIPHQYLTDPSLPSDDGWD